MLFRSLSIVATEENFNSVKSRLLRELKDRFDALYDYTFESVNYIPREPSGKLRLVERIS